MLRIDSDLITASHEAMATEFSVTIAHADSRYARQAAAEAWRELDRLEELLSRYVSHSDVARVGRAAAGSALAIDADTCDCLEIALQVESITRGAFNIAYRHQPPRSAATLLKLCHAPPTVQVADSQVSLDLGGIGKGYALDRIAALFQDWDVPSFLLQASASTLLAGSPPPGKRGWELQFGPRADRQRLCLRNAAFSGSGTGVKGDHIVEPHSGSPATHFLMTWAGAASGAEADAFSTGLMAMRDGAIRDFCRLRPDCLAFVLPHGQARVIPFHAATDSVYRQTSKGKKLQE